ncbi:MAG: energy transducer TonB, partial [Alphaproteobacteria bacterium]
MSDTSHTEALTRHNPFDDPKPRARPGTMIALILALVAHVGLGFYLWTTRFEPKYKEYSDEVTD